MRFRYLMKHILSSSLTMFLAESVHARGWHGSGHSSEWLYQLVLGILAIFLLFFLIKKPVKTVMSLLTVVVLPAMLLLAFGHLDKNYGILVAIAAVPIMWFVILKFIDLVFKNDEKPKHAQPIIPPDLREKPRNPR